ncbi:MAG: methylmalonyl-CoA mutase family protein, partial [Candidatus Sigynarchaeota archaeon]
TQQIIAHESGVANTIDPLGGSYYVEWLTNKMEEEAEKYFKKIDELGGVIPAIKKNFFQMEIARSAYEYQKQIESGEQSVVAVNFQKTSSCGPKVDLLKIGPEVAEKQIAKLAKVKATRDNTAVSAALAKVKAAARSTDNLVYPILEAVKAYASVGEIIATLKEVFGVHKEDAIF